MLSEYTYQSTGGVARWCASGVFAGMNRAVGCILGHFRSCTEETTDLISFSEWVCMECCSVTDVYPLLDKFAFGLVCGSLSRPPCVSVLESVSDCCSALTSRRKRAVSDVVVSVRSEAFIALERAPNVFLQWVWVLWGQICSKVIRKQAFRAWEDFYNASVWVDQLALPSLMRAAPEFRQDARFLGAGFAWAAVRLPTTDSLHLRKCPFPPSPDLRGASRSPCVAGNAGHVAANALPAGARSVPGAEDLTAFPGPSCATTRREVRVSPKVLTAPSPHRSAGLRRRAVVVYRPPVAP